MISVAEYSHALSTDRLKNHLQQLDGLRLSTTEQLSRHRLEWLKEIVGREYANVDITVPEQTHLYNEMFIYPWQQGLRLSPICSHGITFERLAKTPSSTLQDCYLVVLLLSGQYQLEQANRRVVLKPGEMSFYDATEPHRICTQQPFSKVLISIPRMLLEDRTTNIHRLTATRLPTESGLAKIMASMIHSTIFQLDKLDYTEFQSLAMPILDMFTQTLTGLQGNGYRQMSNYQASTLFIVKKFIAANLTDSELNAEKISHAVGLSQRYINNLFNKENTSLMRYLRQQRLAYSRQLLISPNCQHLTVTEIAMTSGFNNMAHFSRIFHQAYGSPPSQYRFIKQ